MGTGVRWGALVNPFRRPGCVADALPVLGISCSPRRSSWPLALAVLSGLLVDTGIERATDALCRY